VGEWDANSDGSLFSKLLDTFNNAVRSEALFARVYRPVHPYTFDGWYGNRCNTTHTHTHTHTHTALASNTHSCAYNNRSMYNLFREMRRMFQPAPAILVLDEQVR
jgi:hypothetical protein